MKAFLWMVQILLALSFFAWGAYTVIAFPQAVARLPWMVGHRPLVTFIGLAEMAGALGLILPGLTGICPRLTAWAAAGLGVIMILATGFHFVRAEYSHVPGTIILLAMSSFVVWGRACRRSER